MNESQVFSPDGLVKGISYRQAVFNKAKRSTPPRLMAISKDTGKAESLYVSLNINSLNEAHSKAVAFLANRKGISNDSPIFAKMIASVELFRAKHGIEQTLARHIKLIKTYESTGIAPVKPRTMSKPSLESGLFNESGLLKGVFFSNAIDANEQQHGRNATIQVSLKHENQITRSFSTVNDLTGAYLKAINALIEAFEVRDRRVIADMKASFDIFRCHYKIVERDVTEPVSYFETSSRKERDHRLLLDPSYP